MVDLTAYPTYNWQRPLGWGRTPPTSWQTGIDVYALQSAINSIFGQPPILKVDGVLGPITHDALKRLQTRLGLESDGVAGPLTWRAVDLRLVGDTAVAGTDAFLVAKAQLQRESLFFGGAYSPKHSDGWWDLGTAQMNLANYAAADAVPPQHAISTLLANVQDAYNRYSNTTKFVGSDHSDKRRWGLAAGHWNAPAFTNWLAGSVGPSANPGPVGTPARDAIEDYCAGCSIYL